MRSRRIRRERMREEEETKWKRKDDFGKIRNIKEEEEGGK